ncbi:MAG: DNA primase [Gemmatimonadaceae bacterium]|nr:DNA primase [Gemmatimonadaceae bacterium]
MIADDVIERVRLAADIVQIIGEYVPLKRAGASYRGPCPFHQGTKPNFSVTPDKGNYHCFVCHESGDVFTFLRKRLGLDWVGAVKLVGERVGIEVIDQPTRAHAPDPNERNWEVLATAAEWFRTQLADDVVGREARAYLAGRGLDAAACARFGIGFAPRDAQALRRYLNGLGFDETRQLDAGLLARRETDAEPRARFVGRIMFPILDELSHHVAFGGRAMGDAIPKYLNSGESGVFQKRRTLYGLQTAKQAMRRAGRAIVVEGYLDAIRLALAGIEEVVAPLGTALTEEQAALLMRYSSEVFLLYDSDKAGQEATFRSGLELLRHKAAVRVVSLPEGEDPDTFVRSQGRAGLETQLTQAIDLFDRQLQLLERRGWFADLRHRRRAIDKLLPTIRAARDPLTRDLYLARLADVSHLDKATLASEADEPPATGRGRGVRHSAEHVTEGPPDSEAPPPENPEGAAPPTPYVKRPWTPRRGKPEAPEWQSMSALPKPRRDEPDERALVRAMIASRDWVERIAERHAPSDFRDANYRAIFAALLSAGHADSLDQVAAALSPEALQALRELTETGDTHPPEASDVTLSLARIAARRIEARIEEIRSAMGIVQPEQQNALMRERMELEGELRKLLPIRSPRGNRKG